MSDCPNVEIREQLPEYLNGTLSAHRRAEVEAHLAGCEDCSDELELLQLVREAYTEAAPAMNVNAIVSALPTRAARPAIRSWRRNHAFQIAAAVSFIAIGSLAVTRSFFTTAPEIKQIDTVAIGETPISFAGGLSDLGDEDVEALITALESIEALPVVEPSEPPLNGTGRQGS